MRGHMNVKYIYMLAAITLLAFRHFIRDSFSNAINS